MRKVKIPLKLKLLTLMIVLIATSLSIFVGIALKTFHDDKSAYIFESLLHKANSEQTILSQILGIGSLQIKGSDIYILDKSVSEAIKETLSSDRNYDSKIVIPQNSEFFQLKDNTLSLVQGEEKDLLKSITKNSLQQTVKEVTIKGEKLLYAFDYNPKSNFAFIVTLPVKKAFAVTEYLIHKSLFYGLFILGAAMILSVLLARPLTSQLESLFAMTQDIAKGNFSKRIHLKGSDEVGALSDSVNDMADKIVLYMAEMKEKARLENEVQVAQLVQSSFFPNRSSQDEALSIEAHFEPASECGGDWWGYVDHGDWRVMFLADATGHGVPAALLTATINCCKSSLSFIMETRPEIISEPHEILRYMNQAVWGAGKEIQVTCFVASINKKLKILHYANSSQTPPLLWNGGTSELKKEHFQPLIEANGPRLGQAQRTQYTSHSIPLKTHDTILFYTDGLTEAEDLEKSAYGQRRLLKALSQVGSDSTTKIVQTVIEDLKDFTKTVQLKDDLTVVALKVIA